jgi:biopolymer transport protein ExbD
MRVKKRFPKDADLDITSFMNLMIILVPVLLTSMALSHVTVLDLKLPDMAAAGASATDESENKALELVILPDRFVINFPAGMPLKTVPNVDGKYDYTLLSTVLQEVKRGLEEKGIEKRDIFILSQPNTDYQTLVKAMDTVRSFKAVLVASVVDAELFPEISLGDAPVVPVTGQPASGVTP